MKFTFRRLQLVFYFLFSASIAFGQTAAHSDSTSKKEENISLLIYTRIIRNNNGTFRIDENIVPNFKLNKLLRLELGFRQGETSVSLGSYNHYKIELQSKYFFDKVRLMVRLSDRIVRYTTPTYSNSNYLLVAESRFPLWKSFSLIAAAGYVYTFQRDNVLDVLPTTIGIADHSPTYKVSLRYDLRGKGYTEIVYGAYDVFNPYPVDAPFFQTSFDYHLSGRCSFSSYFRYQFNQSVDNALNEFLSVGLKVRIK